VRGEDMADHGKPPAVMPGVRSAGDPIPDQYPLDTDFCELSRSPTGGRRTEDPVTCDRQATSASLPDRPDRQVFARCFNEGSLRRVVRSVPPPGSDPCPIGAAQADAACVDSDMQKRPLWLAGWLDGVMASYLRLLVDRDVMVIRDGQPEHIGLREWLGLGWP
jgi:hypothetical protein